MEKGDGHGNEEEGGCDVKLAVSCVLKGEMLETRMDLPQNEDTAIVNADSALELNSQAGITDGDLLTILPPEIGLKIFVFLDPKDLFNLAQTCHILRFLSEHDKLWNDKCKDADLPYRLSSMEDGILGRCDTMNSKLKKVLKLLKRKKAFFEFSRWKANFLKHLRMEINFRQNPIRTPIVLSLDDGSHQTCLEFVGNKIVQIVLGSSSLLDADAAFVKIYDPLSGICQFKLKGHYHGEIADDQVILSRRDTDFAPKVWNVNTGQYVRTLQGKLNFGDYIVRTHLYEGILVSGTRRGTVRLWKVHEGTCINVFVGHQDTVTCVRYNGKLVASGSADTTVKIWNPETDACLRTFKPREGGVLSVEFAGPSGEYVVWSSLNTKTIRVWGVETGLLINSLEGYEKRSSKFKEEALKLRGNVMVSGCRGSTVKIWDTRSWNCLQLVGGSDSSDTGRPAHRESINTFDFNDKFLATGAGNKAKLWDLKTGHFIRDLLVLQDGDQRPRVNKIRIKGGMMACEIVSSSGSKQIRVFNFDTNMRSLLDTMYN